MDNQAEIRQQDGECSLVPEGRLDYSNTVNFHSRCNSLIAMPEASRVILDCGKLTYIDSSGIGALMVINDRVTREGKSLELHNCSSDVKKVLKLVNLHKVLKLV